MIHPLFHSVETPGAMMNRYGTVMFAGKSAALMPIATRDAVWREAKAAGWTRAASEELEDKDVGQVWVPPAAQLEIPGTGNGS